MRYKAKVSRAKAEELEAIKHCVRRDPIPVQRIVESRKIYKRAKAKAGFWKEIARS